jgi:membrane fusion protein (multidrug efflux system)
MGVVLLSRFFSSSKRIYCIDKAMKKKIFFALIGVLVVAGLLAGIKALQISRMVDQSAQFRPPPEPVTTVEVTGNSWESLLSAVGSLAAVQGVTVAAELPGKVVHIAFQPGMKVAACDLLVRQDTTAEEALLPGAEAAVALAKTSLNRTRELLADQAVSQAEMDRAVAGYQQALSEAESLRATIAKKTIRAPFAGRLGIRQVNLGQILEAGNEIVTLQALDPIFVDFLLPQQQLSQLKTGLTVRVTSNALLGKVIEGQITTINPKVEETTRNIKVQATIRNTEEQLRPGMYVDVKIVLPVAKDVLVIPVTAVLYAPYSDSVFIVEDDAGQAKDGQEAGKVLRQQFVRLGEKRGDFVEVVSGLQAGETVVTTGVFKLRNGQAVVIDNMLQPEFKLDPEPEDK